VYLPQPSPVYEYGTMKESAPQFGEAAQATAGALSRIAVLTSGGLDSAVLVAEAARRYDAVFPIYIRSGLAWEEVELEHLRRFLASIRTRSLQDLVVMDMPVRDLYGEHWSLTSANVPDAASEDSAVYLPGRNLLLMLKAMIWCQLHEAPLLALGLLKGNPFPDATPGFFTSFQHAVNAGIEGSVRIVRPFSELRKVDVIRLGSTLPLEWSFSCINPQHGRHCGRCNKCAERRRAFEAAGISDPTAYAME